MSKCSKCPFYRSGGRCNRCEKDMLLDIFKKQLKNEFMDKGNLIEKDEVINIISNFSINFNC